MRIRSHLLLLAAGAMLPVLAFAVLVSIVLVEQDNATVQRGALDRARAMMSGVDAALRGSISTIEALTASSSLASDDLRAFHAEAVRVLATQPTWLDVTLTGPSGAKVVDISQPFGQPLPRLLDPPSAARVQQTKRPVIGNVDSSEASGPGLPIRVPVMRDGSVAYVLTAIVRPDSFDELIREQRLPAGWISGIVDSNGQFVARIPARSAGTLASERFRSSVLRAPEGWYRGLTVDDKDTFTAHVRSEFSGWSIGLAIPAEIVLAGVHRTSWLIGIGVLASIALAMALVGVSGRRIARPIVSLAAVARSIGSGEARAPAVSGDVQEVSEVDAALHDADVAVRERQQLIQRERDALQAADRAKDEFIAALSHELRNPLAALTAASHILRVAEPTHAAATDARSVVDRQTKHMSRMIEDLLDVSRIIMGKANLTLEIVDLAQLATHTVAAWRSGARFAEHRIVIDTQPVWVRADRTRMEQILSNLLDNAVKFTLPGTRITVKVGAEENVALLSVADEGPGLAPDLKARVFDLFVQGEQGVGRAKGGMGVGLALVKRLAELQGGAIFVASDGVGTGATFTVRLPAVENPAPGVGGSHGEPHRAKPCRVLVVEDNRDAREMLRQVLEMNGHQVYDAANGTLGVAAAGEHSPDVAIVDIGLPDIDGYEVARLIRTNLNGRVALIALTGYGQPEDRHRAVAAGFDIHLVKPVTIERLDEAMAAASMREHPRSRA